MFLEGRGDSFIPDYVNIGNKLKNCGCTELCMCCNTAHYALEELEKLIGLPFINILKEVAIQCKELGARRVGLMCTDGLRKIGLYEKYFTLINPQMKIVYPNEEIQTLVTLGICNAKTLKEMILLLLNILQHCLAK